MIRKTIWAAWPLVLGFAGCLHAGNGAEQAFVEGVMAANRAAKPIPSAQALVDGLDMAGAYRLQHGVVARQLARGEVASGYKGSLMSGRSMSEKGVDRPLIGRLFARGAVEAGGIASLCGYRHAIFEVKLAFVMGQDRRAPVASLRQARSLVSMVVPVIELPDIAYADPAAYSAIDMVASNISSARYVRGAARAPGRVDLDELAVTLRRDGQEVSHGMGRESLDGQWDSVRQVINMAIAHDGAVRRGQLILTGKIGAKGDALPGRYRADYGALGLVDFTVASCAGRGGNP